MDREGYSENNHLVVQSSIPSVPHGSTCDWLNLSRDNAHKDTDPQEGSVIGKYDVIVHTMSSHFPVALVTCLSLIDL